MTGLTTRVRALVTHLHRHRGTRGEAGVAALVVALCMGTVFMGCAAIGVDVSRWYVEAQRVQKAADAAATAGVTYLPDDFASARATAIRIAGLNGFPTGVSVSVGSKPTQLVVTVSEKVTNEFGTVIGVPDSTISRSATADYVGPAPMGSPCNSFGNESDPLGLSGDSVRGPATRVTVNPTGGAQCGNSAFWGAIAGPDTDKANGDQYATRTCGTSGTSGCSGSTNTDFDPQGYFYLVRVGAAAVGHTMRLQIYDPAWVATGDTCNTAPTSGIRNGMNTFAPDATVRYPTTPTSYCTGDVDNTSGGNGRPIVTSYVLRAPTTTYAPNQAPALLPGSAAAAEVGAPMGCDKQYPGYDTVTAANLTKGNGGYNDSIARVFHQWVTFCTFTPDQQGDYYLQVRTDVPLGGSADGDGGYNGNAAVATQSGDNTSTHGIGNNRFALRIDGDATARANVSLAGWSHMAIYANATAAQPTFNLVRVVPAAATKTLELTFFDVGDVTQSGTVQVLPPLESNLGPTLSGCLGSGVVNGSLSSCTLSGVYKTTYNGRTQIIDIPIPQSYTCDSNDAGGCWFRVRMSFPGGMSDTTTWSAQITGDPVRLIQ